MVYSTSAPGSSVRWFEAGVSPLSALLMLSTLAISLYSPALPSAAQVSSTQIEIEVLGPILVVDLRTCLNESYAVIEAVGSPIAVLQVEPPHVYAALEGGFVSILATHQPICASVRYVSEAERVEDVLRIAYSRRVSKLTVVVNLSNSVPVLLSPDPDYVEVLSEGAVAFVWLDVENILVEYLVFEREPAAPTVAPLTATPTETTTREATQVTKTTPQQATTPRTTDAPRSDAVSETTGVRERGWAVAAVAGLAAALAVIVVLLKFARRST